MLGKTFIILFACYFAVTRSCDREGFPDYVYSPENNGWLKLHRERMDWQEARITCHLEEALLAADWNAEMRAAINKLQSSEDQSFQALYAGAEVTMTVSDDGKYRYSEGEPVLSVFPGGMKRSEQCTVFITNGTIEQVDCNQKLPYVCFAPAPACGKDSLGYKFSDQTGHCYKYHSQTANWTDAYKACGQEGAYLAVVNSEYEAEVLKQLLPSTNVYGANDVVAIGFYYWKLSNSWWTINGQTIEQAGFAKWKSGEPTLTAYPTAIGGFLSKDGRLFSYYINNERPFICEKNPIMYNNIKNIVY